MALIHPLRRTGVQIITVVLCLLLLLTGFAPKSLPGWFLKPVFGWNWLALIQSFPGKLPREFLIKTFCVSGYVRDALSQVEDEKVAVEAERDAFQTFAESVQMMDANSRQSLHAPATTLVSSTPDHEQLQQIQDRYRETIIAVPNYEEEYGETLRENMATEFSDELATAVLDGQQFTPRIKSLLVNQAEAAAKQREALLEAIDDEHESLTDARRRLELPELPCEGQTELELSNEPFENLIEYDRRSRQHEKRYAKLLADRQRHLHKKTRWGRESDAPFLQEYLYRDFDIQFPVLHAGIEQIKRLRNQRRIVDRLIARLN
jgi:hypothetical protein